MRLVSFIFFIAFSAAGHCLTVPESKRLAGDFIADLMREDYGKAAGYADDSIKDKLTAGVIEQVWKGILAESGKPQGHEEIQAALIPPDSYDTLAVLKFEKQLMSAKMRFNASGKLVGLFFIPKEQYTPPSYANPMRFTETEVVIGSGKWALPATLSLPKGKGKFPALVLVHGSGPNDRDESLGPNKPFRDLAQGLAAQGIAVLRYDKRTFAHGMSLTPDMLRSFTVKEETVDDAAAAVNFMRGRKEIDRSKVFVLGHSMGGSLIPRISSAAGGKCAGFIVFAGSTEPLEDAIVRQTAYLSALDGEITEEEKTAVEKAKADAARIKDPALSQDGPVIAGAAPAYWLDLRGYYPPDAAKKIGKPLLVLQGERDYNVTMTDFKNWKTALSSKNSVKFKSYPKLNHDFAEGKGPVTAEESLKAANVAGYVVDDIAGWIKAR